VKLVHLVGFITKEINLLVSISEMACVHCAVRTEYRKVFQVNFVFNRPPAMFTFFVRLKNGIIE
jgi:hypothetical protein